MFPWHKLGWILDFHLLPCAGESVAAEALWHRRRALHAPVLCWGHDVAFLFLLILCLRFLLGLIDSNFQVQSGTILFALFCCFAIFVRLCAADWWKLGSRWSNLDSLMLSSWWKTNNHLVL
ncbi:hypothetical protein M758_3G028800, partial [Ceratodon purpureus]